MNCPHCASATTKEQTQRTILGYRLFRCATCKHRFHERTGTPFNFLEYPTDVVLLVVLWRLRYKLSLRDLAEMFLERGWEFTHEAVREWEMRFAPLVAEQLRTKRRGHAGQSWDVDETYVRVGTAPLGGGQFGPLSHSLDSMGGSPYASFSRSSPCSRFQAARFRMSLPVFVLLLAVCLLLALALLW